MIDASVLRSLHYEGRFPNVPGSERIGRKAIIDEITAPVPCESPFFQVHDGALFFFLASRCTRDINAEKRDTPDFSIYANIKFLRKIGRETKLLLLVCLVLVHS